MRNFLSVTITCLLWLGSNVAAGSGACDGLTRTSDDPIRLLGELFSNTAKISIREKRCIKNLEVKNLYLAQDESYFHDGLGDDRYRIEGPEFSNWSVLDSGIVAPDQLFIQQSIDDDAEGREFGRDSLETLTGYRTTGSNSQPD